MTDRIAMAKTYEVEHGGMTYKVKVRTITGRVVRITRRVKSVTGARDYKLIDPDFSAERNATRLAKPEIRAVVAMVHEGKGTLLSETY